MARHSRGSKTSSRTVIYAAIAGNLLVAVTKFGAAIFTGSSAMLSEGVHSVVDTGNELLLLYGFHRAAAPPDRDHPWGYGREIYFWSFVVALLVFALGAVVAFVEGLQHVLHPHAIAKPIVNYVVLGLSVLFEGSSWLLALRSFKAQKPYATILGAIHESKDPPSFMVLFEDSAALIGLVVAFIGTFAAAQLKLPVLDGVASLVIGLVLAATAALLARETKGLLIGERADQAIIESIKRIAEEIDGVAAANGVVTVHLAPHQIVAALSVEFDDALRTPEIEAKIIELEARVRRAHRGVITVFVRPRSAAGFRQTIESPAQ